MKRKLIVAAVLIAGTTAASAERATEAQRTVIRYLLEATMIAKKCPYLVANERVANDAMDSAGIPRNAFAISGVFHAEANEISTGVLERVGQLSADGACAMGQAKFGSQGEQIPSLLVTN
ncbi:hypothetical protein SAMN04488498_104352 [Mesorhizobium albiziae]|uniref:Uncharacterized protein n=1 Tax=Neomesorhizobium albiziae TaxID=335020 RepID=A0A1I3YEQ8_9HYPH|nr:hypothetical protein [Mesorhizobium albiziae]GLS29943.1 hypothetical protein GCM10007937_16510 [Mesorhizobium albiziae]SFK29666.1 hypothetical protein SAMN04488498_104352 [Mesorhizobium albiziae]